MLHFFLCQELVWDEAPGAGCRVRLTHVPVTLVSPRKQQRLFWAEIPTNEPPYIVISAWTCSTSAESPWTCYTTVESACTVRDNKGACSKGLGSWEADTNNKDLWLLVCMLALRPKQLIKVKLFCKNAKAIMDFFRSLLGRWLCKSGGFYAVKGRTTTPLH